MPKKLKFLAGAAGFEPATLGFGDRCSSQTELRSCVSHDVTCWGFVLAPSSGDGSLVNSNTLRIHGSNAFVRSGGLFCVASARGLAMNLRKSSRSAIRESPAFSKKRNEMNGQGGL